MRNENLDTIKKEVQFIIDSIAKKNYLEARITFNKVKIDLDDLIDITVDEETLIEISKYQVLIDYLSTKFV